MSDQETEELVGRWMRIWGGDEPFVYANRQRQGVVGAIRKDGNIEITLGVESAILAEVNNERGILACLICQPDTGQIYSPPSRAQDAYTPEQNQPFVDRWLAFFRRGCWLSGFSVEVSAHEKAEWMRGFTKEEIESWNLKI